jgi:hypothetical protein
LFKEVQVLGALSEEADPGDARESESEFQLWGLRIFKVDLGQD